MAKSVIGVKMEAIWYCRVCGFELEDAPWGEDGKTPSYEICPCCGVEFGYEDHDLISIRNYRNIWTQDGHRWFLVKKKPKDWLLSIQMQRIPAEFQ